MMLVLVRGLRESVDEIIVGIEGSIVVPNGRHNGYIAVVRGIVGARYTCKRTLSIIVLESIRRVKVLCAGLIPIGSKVGLLLTEMGGTLCLLWGR